MPLLVNLFRLLLKLVSNVSDMLVDIDFGRLKIAKGGQYCLEKKVGKMANF